MLALFGLLFFCLLIFFIGKHECLLQSLIIRAIDIVASSDSRLHGCPIALSLLLLGRSSRDLGLFSSGLIFWHHISVQGGLSRLEIVVSGSHGRVLLLPLLFCSCWFLRLYIVLGRSLLLSLLLARGSLSLLTLFSDLLWLLNLGFLEGGLDRFGLHGLLSYFCAWIRHFFTIDSVFKFTNFNWSVEAH